MFCSPLVDNDTRSFLVVKGQIYEFLFGSEMFFSSSPPLSLRVSGVFIALLADKTFGLHALFVVWRIAQRRRLHQIKGQNIYLWSWQFTQLLSNFMKCFVLVAINNNHSSAESALLTVREDGKRETNVRFGNCVTFSVWLWLEKSATLA